MSSFFVVKGELAAWALGLDQDEVVSEEDVLVLEAAQPPVTMVKRRTWRMRHEDYRPIVVRRREPAER